MHYHTLTPSTELSRKLDDLADKVNKKQNIRSMLLSFLRTHKNDNADVARPWKTGALA